MMHATFGDEMICVAKRVSLVSKCNTQTQLSALCLCQGACRDPTCNWVTQLDE